MLIFLYGNWACVCEFDITHSKILQPSLVLGLGKIACVLRISSHTLIGIVIVIKPSPSYANVSSYQVGPSTPSHGLWYYFQGQTILRNNCMCYYTMDCIFPCNNNVRVPSQTSGPPTLAMYDSPMFVCKSYIYIYIFNNFHQCPFWIMYHGWNLILTYNDLYSNAHIHELMQVHSSIGKSMYMKRIVVNKWQDNIVKEHGTTLLYRSNQWNLVNITRWHDLCIHEALVEIGFILPIFERSRMLHILK